MRIPEVVLDKHSRAATLLEETRRLARDYWARTPFLVERTENAAGDLIYRVRIRERVPTSWAPVIGDAVGNLRSCLDNLCWAAVKANGATPGSHTAFPFARSQSTLTPLLAKCLVGAHPSTQALVRRLKPHDGGNARLWKLHRLDISDKHRASFIVGAAYRAFNIKLQIPGFHGGPPITSPEISIRPADRQFPLSDGAELFAIRAQARDGAILDPTFTFDVAFGDTEQVVGEPVFELMEDLHKYVGRVITLFGEHARP
jgi:hypothetical protein